MPFKAKVMQASSQRRDWATFQAIVFEGGKEAERGDLDRFSERLIAERDARGLYALMVPAWSKGERLLFLPHWLILLAVAAPLTALLVWRLRRRTRAGAEDLQK